MKTDRLFLLLGAIVVGVLTFQLFAHDTNTIDGYGVRTLGAIYDGSTDILSSFRVPVDPIDRAGSSGFLVVSMVDGDSSFTDNSAFALGMGGLHYGRVVDDLSSIDLIYGYRVDESAGKVYFIAYSDSDLTWYEGSKDIVDEYYNSLTHERDLFTSQEISGVVDVPEQNVFLVVEKVELIGDDVAYILSKSATMSGMYRISVYDFGANTVEYSAEHVDDAVVFAGSGYTYVASSSISLFDIAPNARALTVAVFGADGEYIGEANIQDTQCVEPISAGKVGFVTEGDHIYVVVGYMCVGEDGWTVYPQVEVFEVSVEGAGSVALAPANTFLFTGEEGESVGELEGVIGAEGRFMVVFQEGVGGANELFFASYIGDLYAYVVDVDSGEILSSGKLDNYGQYYNNLEKVWLHSEPFNSSARVTYLWSSNSGYYRLLDVLYPISLEPYVPHITLSRAEIYDDGIFAEANVCNLGTADMSGADSILFRVTINTEEDGIVYVYREYVPAELDAGECVLKTFAVQADQVLSDAVPYVLDGNMFSEDFNYFVSVQTVEEYPVDYVSPDSLGYYGVFAERVDGSIESVLSQSSENSGGVSGSGGGGGSSSDGSYNDSSEYIVSQDTQAVNVQVASPSVLPGTFQNSWILWLVLALLVAMYFLSRRRKK